LSAANGQVDLQWSHEAGGRLHLRWTETGGPAVVETPTRKGLGSRIIEQVIAHCNLGAAVNCSVKRTQPETAI
jgi:two-component sensor histidine kinase